MKEGIRMRLTGHSDAVYTLQFGQQVPKTDSNSEANVQNAVTYNDQGLAKQKKGELNRAMSGNSCSPRSSQILGCQHIKEVKLILCKRDLHALVQGHRDGRGHRGAD